MNKITVTRKSKVGFGYRTAVTNDSNGWHIDPPESPDFIGTVKTVSEQINQDATLNSLQNTFKSQAWFVRYDNNWVRISANQANHITELLNSVDGEFSHHSMTLECELAEIGQ